MGLLPGRIIYISCKPLIFNHNWTPGEEGILRFLFKFSPAAVFWCFLARFFCTVGNQYFPSSHKDTLFLHILAWESDFPTGYSGNTSKQRKIGMHGCDSILKLIHWYADFLVQKLKCILRMWHVSTFRALCFMDGFHGEQETWWGEEIKGPREERQRKRSVTVLHVVLFIQDRQSKYRYGSPWLYMEGAVKMVVSKWERG